jgi:hypothetical protein
MAAIYAEPADVAAAWRPLSADEEVIATTFLEWVSARLRRKVPNLGQRLADDEEDLAVLVTATAAMATARAMMNPEGWRSETIDDYTRTRDAAVSSGALYVSAEDVADLMPSAALPGIYSISLGAPDYYVP